MYRFKSVAVTGDYGNIQDPRLEAVDLALAVFIKKERIAPPVEMQAIRDEGRVYFVGKDAHRGTFVIGAEA